MGKAAEAEFDRRYARNQLERKMLATLQEYVKCRFALKTLQDQIRDLRKQIEKLS